MILVLKECYRRKNGKVVFYRDFKLVNIFLDFDNNVKLGDFGLVRVFYYEISFVKIFVGIFYYMFFVSFIK